MTIRATKNAIYYLSFPAIDSATPANYKSGVSPVDTAYYKDGAGAWTTLAITDAATEIGSTGVYEIDFSATEMNHDKIIVKFAVSGMADDAYQFDTTYIDADVLAISGDTTAADNLEATYDGTGYSDDNAPATQAQVGSLATGSSAISTQAESYVLTTGTQSSGTITDTETLDGVYHEHTDSAGVMDLYYQFDVGPSGTATDTFLDYVLNGSNDSLDVFAYDWGNTAWDALFTLTGTNSTLDREDAFDLLTRHTGTGANLGKVRIRFYAASGLTTATLKIDRIFTSYAVVNQSAGYLEGAVWIDTNGTNSGTVVYVDGTADNAVNNIADATTISQNLGTDGIFKFHLLKGTSITLAQTYNRYIFNGSGGIIALGGQDVAFCTFEAQTLSGIGVGTGRVFARDCRLDTVSLNGASINDSSVTGTFSVTEATDYVFNNCVTVNDANTTIIDFAVVGNACVTFHNWSGDLEVRNLTAGDEFHLHGVGEVTFAASCTGGVAQVVGNFIKTNNGTVAPTYGDFDDTLDAILVDTGTTIPASLAVIDTNVDQIEVAVITNAAGTDISADVAAVKVDTAAILVDTGTTLPGDISGLNDFNPTTDTVANVTLVATTTTNTDMRGTDSAALATSLATTDSKVDGIKSKTDSLTFTTAGEVDANIQSVNDVVVDGTGALDDEWGPA